MRCAICDRKVGAGERVIPVLAVVGNEKRGDFVASQPSSFVHLSHLTEVLK